jgi:phage-related protein
MRTKYGTLEADMDRARPLEAVFYRTESGNEPVREWLKALDRSEKKLIGEDIKTVQFGWPVGMPVARKLGLGLWEIRVGLERATARVLFTVFNDSIVLLHGFIKKSRRTPLEDLALAKERLRKLKGS